MEKRDKNSGRERGCKKAVAFIIIACMAMCFMPETCLAQTLKINIHEAQFTQAAIERLVDEYQKVNTAFKAEVVKETKGVGDATISLSTGHTDYNSTFFCRFMVLPVVNSENELLQNKKVQRGLTDKLERQIYVERDVLETIEANENGEKPLPGTVYTLCENKAVTKQVLADKLQVSPSRIRGKKILGREENLLMEVQRHPDAISYNVATLLYNIENRLPQTGLTVLAIDLDGNGKISNEERMAIDNLDTLTDYLGHLSKTNVPIGHVNIVTENAQLKQFVNWALSDGQQFLGHYGLLKAEPQLTAKR